MIVQRVDNALRAFNRTIVELKQSADETTTTDCLLLIVP